MKALVEKHHEAIDPDNTCFCDNSGSGGTKVVATKLQLHSDGNSVVIVVTQDDKMLQMVSCNVDCWVCPRLMAIFFVCSMAVEHCAAHILHQCSGFVTASKFSHTKRKRNKMANANDGE